MTLIRPRFRITALALIMAACMSAVLQAQTATMDIVITEAGSARAGLTVQLRDPATGYAQTVTTNAQGRARLPTLPASGRYQISVDGVLRLADVALRANESQTIAIEMAIEEVDVLARRAVVALNATNAEVSAGLGREDIDALPIEARDLVRALTRLPNVVASTGFYPEAPSVAINGANGLFTQYLIDGLDNTENFLGGQKFPVSSGFANDVTVLASSYSVEYGRTGNGVVNVTTPGGSNVTRGEFFYLSRPGPPLDSSSPYAQRDLSGNTLRDGFRRDQLGFSLGGALAQDRTFYFVNAEYLRDQKDNLLTSAPLGIAATVPGENRSLLLSAKIDHVVSDDWRLALRANLGDMLIERQGGGLDGGATFPSAGSAQDRDSMLIAASAIFDDGHLASQTQIAASRFRWNYGRARNGAGPQVVVEDAAGLTAAILGHPGYVFDDLERSLQLQQKFSFERGAHAFKFGADVLRSEFALAGGGNADGNYRVRLTPAELAAVRALNRGAALAPGDIPATAAVLDYSVELRPATFGETQTQYALYAEDQWSLTPNFTATLGLRWDYDTLTKAGAASGDTDNIAPRLAFNWRLDSRWSLRAGVGLFYEKIPYTIASDALQQNTTSAAFRGQLAQLIAAGRLPADTNIDRLVFDGNLSVNPACPAGYLNCPTPATAANLRATASSGERRIRNPLGLDSPYTLQSSFGAQWQVGDDLLASADVILGDGRNLLRLRDVNAPAPFTPNLAGLTPANVALLRAQPTEAARFALARSLGLVRSQADADATRPVAAVPGGARQIVVSETGGESRYRALNFALERARRDGESTLRYGYRLSYTLSKLSNDTDDLNFRASNSNEFDAEWGPSINDRRHALSAVLFLYPSESLTVTVAGLFQSGQPINLIPDTGIFGSTDLNGDGASFSSAYLGNSDRAPGIGRNSARLPWSKLVDLGVRYEHAMSLGRLELTADVFNLFDTANLSGFANSATQSNQIQVEGQPFVAAQCWRAASVPVRAELAFLSMFLMIAADFSRARASAACPRVRGRRKRTLGRDPAPRARPEGVLQCLGRR